MDETTGLAATAPTRSVAPTNGGATERVLSGWRPSAAAPYGLVPAIAMVLLTLVDAAETSIVTGVLPLLQEEWGFGDIAAGAIPTASVIAGLALVLPAGYLADRTNRTRLLGIVVASWSVITLGSAVALGFGMFFVTRAFLGAAQSIDNPSVSSLLTDYYSPVARARAFGYQRVSLAVGAGLGAAIGGIVGERFGWRWAFGTAIVPGLLVALLVWRLQEPPRGGLDDHLDTAPPHAIDTARAPTSNRERIAAIMVDVRTVMAVPTARLMYLGIAIFATSLGSVIFWLPTFFVRTHDLGEGRASSVAAAVIGLGSLLGAIVGGEYGDRRHRTDRPVRMNVVVVGLGVGLGVFSVSVLLHGLALQALLMATSLFFVGMVAPTFPAVTADVIGPRHRGIAFSLFQLIANVGLAIGPLVMGLVSDLTGSLTIAFVSLLPLALVGVVIGFRARAHYLDDMAAVAAP